MSALTDGLLSLKTATFGVVTILMSALILGSIGFLAQISAPQTANAAEPAAPVCSVMTLVSGTDTDTAGWTNTNPSASPMNQGLYSGGSYGAAQLTDDVIPPWINPATDADFSGPGAKWVSTDDS